MDNDKECMDCGEPMAIRENSDGEEFWGCTGFPDCRYTESIQDEEEEGFDRNFIDYND